MQPWEGAPGPPKLWEAMQLEKGLGQGCLNHRSNPKELRELSKSHQWWRKEEDAPRPQGEKDVNTQVKKSDDIKELIVVQNI